MPRLFSFIVLGLLAVGAAWSVLLARADGSFRVGTPEGVARAMAQMPANTTYLAFGALQAEYDGRDSSQLLKQIARLNPTSSAPRIRLGLSAEQRGDLVQAERWLQEAFAIDRQFETRWTLANFYFRHGRQDEFWTWIRSALEISYADRHPAFDLCWLMSSDPAEILSRAIPGRDGVAADYLLYLMANQHPNALADAAKKVRDPNLRLAATDVLLDAGRYADAVEVWRGLGRAVPDGVTAPNFESPQTGHGFDWQPIVSRGVQHPRPGRIRLLGSQPESVELLRQRVGGLRPGTRYQLQWISSRDVPGLHWRINGAEVNEFRAASEVVLLSLWYQRPVGEVRAEGSFDLNGVMLLALH